MAAETPWDQRLARWLVRPFARTRLRPNHITTLSLALGGAAGLLLARGEVRAAGWGAALFMLARFIDHADGELARLAGRTSRIGYYYDYVAGALSSVALFAGIGFGYAGGPLGSGALALGLAASSWRTAYLIGPVTWLGGLAGFFVLGALGQIVFSALRLRELWNARPPASPPSLDDPSAREHT